MVVKTLQYSALRAEKVKEIRITVKSLGTGIDLSEQTDQTQIRLLLEQSDQGLHYLPLPPESFGRITEL